MKEPQGVTRRWQRPGSPQKRPVLLASEFGPAELILDVWPPELCENKLVISKASRSLVICWRRNKRAVLPMLTCAWSRPEFLFSSTMSMRPDFVLLTSEALGPGSGIGSSWVSAEWMRSDKSHCRQSDQDMEKAFEAWKIWNSGTQSYSGNRGRGVMQRWGCRRSRRWEVIFLWSIGEEQIDGSFIVWRHDSTSLLLWRLLKINWPSQTSWYLALKITGLFAYSLPTLEAESGRALWVPGQPALHSEFQDRQGYREGP